MKSSSSGQIQKSVHLMQLSWKAIRWLKPNWTHGQRHERIAEEGESKQEHVPDDQLAAPEVSSASACSRAPSSSSSMMTVSSIAGAIDCMPARALGIFCAARDGRQRDEPESSPSLMHRLGNDAGKNWCSGRPRAK